MSINEGCANQKNEMIKNGNKGEAVMKAYTPVPTKFYTFAFHHTYTHTHKKNKKNKRGNITKSKYFTKFAYYF